MENKIIRAAIYSRFSSDLQRNESIDAQVRACKYYAQKEGIEIVKIYCDRAKSGTTIKGREEFLEMIESSSSGDWDLVLVHKLNRFGRDTLDTLQYKRVLESHGVSLISVTEKLDNTPEGKLMLMVIAGMNEFYSANLSNEVMKGLKENAYAAKHNGGVPPLGFDLDRNTMKLVINPTEAEAVRLIYEKYITGAGYTEIIDLLNSMGFKTKRGTAFGKSSLYEILRQEKYTGIYTYNKTASKNMDRKFNRHKYKEDSEIIRLEDMIPQIISKEDFAIVQNKMAARKHKAAQFTAKETYLLTGKIVCGECGANYTGISRKARVDHPQYVSYRCSKKHGKNKCSNTGIRRETIEEYVLQQLSSFVFSDATMSTVVEKYKEYALMADTKLSSFKSTIQERLKAVDKGINNIVSVIASTGSQALCEKLSELESEKSTLLQSIRSMESELDRSNISEKQIKAAFKKAKKMFSQGTLSTNKKIIDKYVDKIVIYKDCIEVKFNLGLPTPHNSKDDCGDSSFSGLLTLREDRLAIN